MLIGLAEFSWLTQECISFTEVLPGVTLKFCNITKLVKKIQPFKLILINNEKMLLHVANLTSKLYKSLAIIVAWLWR